MTTENEKFGGKLKHLEIRTSGDKTGEMRSIVKSLFNGQNEIYNNR